MRTFLFQDWITVAGATRTATTVTQEQGGWLDVSSAGSATFWIDVSQATNSSGYPVTLSVQTSPTLDESYFTPTTPALTMASATNPYVVQTVRAPGLVPLSRYLRWQAASTSGNWTASFRIRVALSPEIQFVPTDLAGCQLWLRADLGVTVVSGAVTTWADQSGNGRTASPGAGATPGYSTNGMNGLPAVMGNGSSSWLQTTAFSFGTTSATLLAAAQPTIQPEAPVDGYARLLEHEYDKTYLLSTDSTGLQYKLIVNDGSSPFGTAQGGAVTQFANTIATGLYSSSSGTGSLYVNGLLVGSGTFTAPSPSFSAQMAIMQAYNNSGAHWWTGYFGEAIVYNRALSAVELARVHRYLGGRYGVAM